MEGVALETKERRADSSSGVQIHQRRCLPEIRSHPVSDIVHGQIPDPLNVADLSLDEGMQCCKISRVCQTLPCGLQPCLCLFEHCFRNASLMRVTLSARKQAESSLLGCGGRGALDLKEPHLRACIVAV